MDKELMDVRMHGQINRWMDRWMYAWIDKQMDRRMDRRLMDVDGQMDGQMIDGCMDGQMIFLPNSLLIKGLVLKGSKSSICSPVPINVIGL